MSRATLVVGCLLLVVAGAMFVPAAARPGGFDTATPPGPPPDASLSAVYPNPVADGDRGEFVVLTLAGNRSVYRLDDGEQSVGLANASVTPDGSPRRVAVTGAPALVANLTDYPVVGVAGFPSLANSGERLVLKRGSETVDTARYRDAPEGSVARYDDRGTVTWRPIGRTNRSVVGAPGGTVTAFVLPDAPAVAVERIREARDRVLLAGYTFSSRRVARALRRAADRGVDVRVVLEGDPVDGLTRRGARLLDSLTEAGVEVRMLGGPRSRYAFHHAKYAVVDDRAVVLTENWKPAGTGGASSRGWGVVVSRSRVVTALAETFRADATWTGAHSWRRFRQGRQFAAGGVANGTYPTRFDPETMPVERTRLLVTPDNAGAAVTGAIDGATESVDVVQMAIDGPDQRFLRAVVRAARRGVEVRVLLSSAWYVREDNARLVEHLRERASAEGLPLQARLADPDGRFEKIHAKGVVVDGDQVLLGSLNWNGESVRENREVVVDLHGEAVGEYYGRVFAADWTAGRGGSTLPVGSAVAVAGVAVLAVLVARRVEFGDETGVRPG